mmetsp:Transcript_14563/g.31563  ORF Transcript_14563/g.31563 Transcript_14563/m.31563 type:complete len:92 (-) Transcript_14563:8-283(-)
MCMYQQPVPTATAVAAHRATRAVEEEDRVAAEDGLMSCDIGSSVSLYLSADQISSDQICANVRAAPFFKSLPQEKRRAAVRSGQFPSSSKL